MAAGAKQLTSQTSKIFTTRSILRRHSGFLQIILAICKPAILNDFDGELSVTELARHASFTLAKGVNVWLGITSSQCISSLITFTPCLMQMSFMRSNSSFVHTLPAGLWGLQSKNTVTFSSAHLRSKSSKSILYVSASRTSSVSSTTQPWFLMLEKKQLYTGVITSTFSPGSVSALTAHEMAGTTPVV